MPSIFPIILNSTNAVSGDASSYVYKFPRGSINLKNASIAISQINMFYSWNNIDKPAYNNSEFQIIFPDGTVPTFTEYSITIPNGNYDIVALNQFLQGWFIQHNKYLIDSSGNYVYYMELLANQSTYTIQLITYPIPTSLPSGWSVPSGGFSFPVQANQKPTLVVASNNNFGKLIGFSPGGYFDHISDITPQMSPVSSVLVTCSMINNKFTNPNNVLFSFVSGSTEFGHMLSIQNQDLTYANIDNGVYTEVTIKFIDNEFRRLNIKDTNLIIYLIVKIED